MKKINDSMKSVRVRLFLTLSTVIAFIIIILVLMNSIILKSFYIYSKVYSIEKAYNDINKLYNDNIDSINQQINNISEKNNFEIVIEDEDNIIVYASNQNAINIINKTKEIEYFRKNSRQILFVKNNITINKVTNNGMDCIFLSGQLEDGNTIYIRIPISAIDESVNISNSLLLIMGIIIIFISAIISSIISRKFTKPILQLNNIANKMSNLDFSEKYRISDSDDEINELGKSINKMSDKLELTIKQLRVNNNQLEKDIEEKSKIDEMRKQFISDVSHELKTPIALIQGYAEGLVENVNTDVESRKYYADVILDESNKMDRLVHQLLELMKIEYGKRDFNNERFNISELINEVIRKCNVMIQEKNVHVIFNENNKLEVFADSFYIEQAFTNYLTNAIKNVKDINGEKTIIINTITNEENNKVRLSVFNTGDNIEEENIDKIWTRFYKVDTSRNRDNGGTGIGLSLVKAIMISYNNSYGVLNKNNGVEFYFDING